MKYVKRLYSAIRDHFYKPGTLVQDHYVILSPIGRGSYGMTYLVYDLARERNYVLKQLKPSRRGSPKPIKQFKREVDLLSNVSHPSIPCLIDHFTEGKDHFYVMEAVPGKTFEDLVFQDGVQYSERESFTILAKVLAVVMDLHQEGIIHHDLRLPNIFYAEGNVHIIDFGLAKRKEEKHANLTDDIYDLGHFALFLLYSTYTPTSKKERPWEEELDLSEAGRRILRRMLQMDEAYTSVEELLYELKRSKSLKVD